MTVQLKTLVAGGVLAALGGFCVAQARAESRAGTCTPATRSAL
jgi:hypothetical protein